MRGARFPFLGLELIGKQTMHLNRLSELRQGAGYYGRPIALSREYKDGTDRQTDSQTAAMLCVCVCVT